MSTLEADKSPRNIILRPVVTEKSSILMDEGKHTFEVGLRVNKIEIKIAIEAISGDKVGQVATQNRKGKTYRARTGQDKHKDVKRAVVTLREGTIDIFDNQA